MHRIGPVTDSTGRVCRLMNLQKNWNPTALPPSRPKIGKYRNMTTQTQQGWTMMNSGHGDAACMCCGRPARVWISHIDVTQTCMHSHMVITLSAVHNLLHWVCPYRVPDAEEMILNDTWCNASQGGHGHTPCNEKTWSWTTWFGLLSLKLRLGSKNKRLRTYCCNF